MNPMLVNDMLGVGQNALERAGYYSCLNALKAGIVYSDMVSTVSPTYAEEIKTPAYGETLDGLIRMRDIRGIMNGIDTSSFNPWTDKNLPARFSKNSLAGKAKCKLALQRELGLAEDETRPLLAVISRLTNQKGLDLFEQALPGIMDLGAEVVVLGMGDSHFEQHFAWEQSMRKGSFAFRAEMNDALARRIYAGSDMFVMPSAFEPCGLSQLFALRYGSIPLVRETGGLADTVRSCQVGQEDGNGFVFADYSAFDMQYVISQAVELYRSNLHGFRCVQERGMRDDFSWNASAGSYEALYEHITDTTRRTK